LRGLKRNKIIITSKLLIQFQYGYLDFFLLLLVQE